MLKHIIIGASLAFAAAVQPGPLQAYLFSRVTASGWRRTLPASFAPLLSDGPIALVALLILGQLGPGLQAVLRGIGGVFLLFLAVRTFGQWRRNERGAFDGEGKTPRTLFEAAMVNLLNPNPYLGWTLILGPVVVTAWREDPRFGIAVVAAFYATIAVSLAGLIILFGCTRLLGGRIQRGLLFLSALILAALGVYQWWLAIGRL